MPLVLGSPLVSYASSAADYVRHNDFTLKERNKRVELDVRMNPTLSLSHYNECLLLYNVFTSIWVQATVLPRSNHLLHDLTTQVFLRSLQYGIVVMGFTDAFVYAHHQHCRSIENPGKFGDCVKGRIRFMTAITSAHAHAHQATCPTRHMPAAPRLNFRLPKPKARYPHHPNIRTTSRERSNDFQGWAIFSDGSTRHVNGETLPGWCYRSISPWKNSCYVWSGHHHRGSSCFLQVPELTPTTPLKCRL